MLFFRVGCCVHDRTRFDGVDEQKQLTVKGSFAKASSSLLSNSVFFGHVISLSPFAYSGCHLALQSGFVQHLTFGCARYWGTARLAVLLFTRSTAWRGQLHQKQTIFRNLGVKAVDP